MLLADWECCPDTFCVKKYKDWNTDHTRKRLIWHDLIGKYCAGFFRLRFAGDRSAQISSLLCDFKKVQSSERTHLAWDLLSWIHLSWLRVAIQSRPSQDICETVGQGLLQEKWCVWEVCDGIWPKFVWGLDLDHSLLLQQHWNNVTWETLCPPRSLQPHGFYGFTDMFLIQTYGMGLGEIYDPWKQAAAP